MSATDHANPTRQADAGLEHESDHDGGHVDHSDWYYGKVALTLALITGLEVAISYMHIGKAYMPILLTLMTIKFFSVVMIFMHLKFDNKLFSWLFYTGLGLALGVYLTVLLTLHVFNGPPAS